jgi:lipopolysaccharide/colanic/teichoic acid biosynthesis glycosyltransferase
MLLRRVESDLEYIDTWSLRRDIVILARTIVPVITARNAW